MLARCKFFFLERGVYMRALFLCALCSWGRGIHTRVVPDGFLVGSLWADKDKHTRDVVVGGTLVIDTGVCN